MRLAVLLNLVSEVLETPIFGFLDGATIVGDQLRRVFRKRVDLGLSQILTRKENMLVKRHVHAPMLADR